MITGVDIPRPPSGVAIPDLNDSGRLARCWPPIDIENHLEDITADESGGALAEMWNNLEGDQIDKPIGMSLVTLTP